MPRKKKTPEEREAERRYREDLTRRLLERIELHRARVAELDRRADSDAPA